MPSCSRWVCCSSQRDGFESGRLQSRRRRTRGGCPSSPVHGFSNRTPVPCRLPRPSGQTFESTRHFTLPRNRVAGSVRLGSHSCEHQRAFHNHCFSLKPSETNVANLRRNSSTATAPTYTCGRVLSVEWSAVPCGIEIIMPRTKTRSEVAQTSTQ